MQQDKFAVQHQNIAHGARRAGSTLSSALPSNSSAFLHMSTLAACRAQGLTQHGQLPKIDSQCPAYLPESGACMQHRTFSLAAL